jgi:hypothetical protein
MDPSSFNIEATNIRKEIQKFIEKTISKFNKCKKGKSSFEKIYLVGGLDNDSYQQFNDELRADPIQPR